MCGAQNVLQERKKEEMTNVIQLEGGRREGRTEDDIWYFRIGELRGAVDIAVSLW
jgi:hypothetical protein